MEQKHLDIDRAKNHHMDFNDHHPGHAIIQNNEKRQVIWSNINLIHLAIHLFRSI